MSIIKKNKTDIVLTDSQYGLEEGEGFRNKSGIHPALLLVGPG